MKVSLPLYKISVPLFGMCVPYYGTAVPNLRMCVPLFGTEISNCSFSVIMLLQLHSILLLMRRIGILVGDVSHVTDY